MPARYPETLEAFLLDEDARRLIREDQKRWRRCAVELLEREYGFRLLALISHSCGSGVDAEDHLHAFYLHELSAKRTVLEQWEAHRSPLDFFLKKCVVNFTRGQYRRERWRPSGRRAPLREEYTAADPETSDPARILFRSGGASPDKTSPEVLSTAVAAFKKHCAARDLPHYWTVFERHDLRPEAFDHPSHADTAAALGRTRRDVTNWLTRGRALVRRFAEETKQICPWRDAKLL